MVEKRDQITKLEEEIERDLKRASDLEEKLKVSSKYIEVATDTRRSAIIRFSLTLTVPLFDWEEGILRRTARITLYLKPCPAPCMQQTSCTTPRTAFVLCLSYYNWFIINMIVLIFEGFIYTFLFFFRYCFIANWWRMMMMFVCLFVHDLRDISFALPSDLPHSSAREMRRVLFFIAMVYILILHT